MSEVENYLEPVAQLAREAGAAILEVYGDTIAVETKADDSPLTAADTASHQILARGLGALTPQIPVLSEEAAAIPYSERQGWDRYWLIDPLDGTKEFINRNGEFTVNVALIERGEPVLGVVYVPVGGSMYLAARGGQAHKLTADGARHVIRVRAADPQALVAVASRSHRSAAIDAYLQHFGEPSVRSIGSSLKICLIAEGEADIYPRLGPTSEWDTAAAQAVLEVAGGRLTDCQLAPLRYNGKAEYLNPHFLAFGDASIDWGAPLA